MMITPINHKILYFFVLGIIIPKIRSSNKNCNINHNTKFEIDKTILTGLNYRQEPSGTDVRTNFKCRKALAPKIFQFWLRNMTLLQKKSENS